MQKCSLITATCVLVVSSIGQSEGQTLSLGAASTSALPIRQMDQVLGFDSGKFIALQGQWLKTPLSDDDLLTLGKGWVATSSPNSAQTANGLQIVKDLAGRGSSSANLTLGAWATDPSLQGMVGDPKIFFAKAAISGNPTAQQALGRTLLVPGTPDFDPSVGFSWLDKSVNAGNVAAIPDLAASYEYGLGTSLNLGKSEQLFMDAAITGAPEQLINYAEFKVRNGASYSDPAVADLFIRAATTGDTSAQLFLADKALKPGASAAAAANALQTLNSLAGTNDVRAMVRLGEYSLAPFAGQPDFAAAENWFQAAAKRGNIEAQNQLGSLYLTRFADQPDKVRLGRQLILSAAAAGSPAAIIASASPTVSPELDPIARYTRALTGFELSSGGQKAAFDAYKLSACDPASSTIQCEPVPVFYFTNRKADPLAGGEADYENVIASDGSMSYGVSRAYAPLAKPTLPGPPPSNWWDIAMQAAGNLPGVSQLSGLLHHQDDEARQQPNDQFKLQNSPNTEDLPTFVKELHGFATNSGRQKAFVYVHGFANSFDGAVDRMALLSQQYNFPGVPIVFSWASANTQFVDVNAVLSGDIALGYVNDLRMVKRSCDAFQRTLEVLVDEFGSGNVMVLAHSMGSELVMDMLTACAGGTTWDGKLKLGPLVFAAPDVDAGEFKLESPLVVTRAQSIALYASQNDIALAISQKLEEPGTRRAGQGGIGLLISPPVQTIDASQVEGLPGGDPNNHGYVFDARQVRQDLVAVLRDTPLDQRDCITDSTGHRDPPGKMVGADPNEYWIVQANCQ